jgi:hypothetical protein
MSYGFIHAIASMRRRCYRTEYGVNLYYQLLVILGVQSTRPHHYALVNYSSAKVLDLHAMRT